MVYLSNHNFDSEVSEAKYVGQHIQEGDVLEIIVSAFDTNAVKPFNKSTMNETGNVTDINTSNPSPSQTQNMSLNIYPVDSEGNIHLPVLGAVYCKGMSKLQLKTDLENRLKQYLTDPMVSIRLTNFNISILGEVANPGQKTGVTEKMNIFQALALAGDIRPTGNRTNVKLIRTGEDGKDKIISLNLTESDMVLSPYYYLQQNDILYVEPDRNARIDANSAPAADKILKYGGIGLGVIGIIITLIRK